MTKHLHEIRDPIHVFIRIDDDERKLVDSRPFQRLRYIHQLALSFLVYPGATHRRFEHSLGVMELADRVFSVITNPDNRDDRVKGIFPDSNHLIEWRQTLRMAALCHDIGHLPFSHGAEKQLLAKGTDHENITLALINSPVMQNIWSSLEGTLTDGSLAANQCALSKRRFLAGLDAVTQVEVDEVLVRNARFGGEFFAAAKRRDTVAVGASPRKRVAIISRAARAAISGPVQCRRWRSWRLLDIGLPWAIRPRLIAAAALAASCFGKLPRWPNFTLAF